MVFVAASGDQDAENGARLTCHILLRLFKTSDMTLTSPGLRPGTKGQCNIKRSCDKHLLAAAHDSITVGPVLAVLKAMLVLSKDIIGNISLVTVRVVIYVGDRTCFLCGYKKGVCIMYQTDVLIYFFNHSLRGI